MSAVTKIIILFLLLLRFASASELESAFARAADDPHALAPLIIAISQELPRLPADEALALADRAAPWCRLLFSATPYPQREQFGFIQHTVSAKETPASIARKYQMTVDLLAHLNPDYSPRNLQTGQTLTVFDAASQPLHYIVSRSTFRLLIWRGAHLIGVLRCGLGRDSSPTPLGNTTITLCVKNPEWRNPDTGKIIPPNDPANILGGFWIGFDPTPQNTFKGIGIHGFTGASPDMWLEKNGSHGCVRLIQDDIAWIFMLTRPGQKVSVRE
jgi:lipoprotein-anchoring transpeptidase ErfK/SrfK